MMITNVFSFSEMKSWLTKNTVPSLWAGKTRLVIINTFTRFTFSLSLSIRTHTHLHKYKCPPPPPSDTKKSTWTTRESRPRSSSSSRPAHFSRGCTKTWTQSALFIEISNFFSNRRHFFFHLQPRAQRPDGRSQQTEPRTAAKAAMKWKHKKNGNSLLFRKF